jgi:hypothetical protein
MRLLLTTLLILLIPSFALAEIELNAPDTCVVGELVVLDASPSLSVELVWEITPTTDDFKIFGKQACFSGREPGEYLVIIAGVEEGVPVLRTHRLVVEGGAVSSDLATRMKGWAKTVTSENVSEEALKFAQSFRALAGAKIPVEQMLEATADANRRALGESLDAWKPFLDRLGLYLDSLAVDGKLKTAEQYKETWLRLADVIEECFR